MGRDDDGLLHVHPSYDSFPADAGRRAEDNDKHLEGAHVARGNIYIYKTVRTRSHVLRFRSCPPFLSSDTQAKLVR